MSLGALLLVAGGAVLAASLAFVGYAAAKRGPHDTFGIALLRAFTILYARWVHRLRAVGCAGDPIPATGAFILVANHRSGVDPVLLAVLTLRHVHYLMAREYYDIPVVRMLVRALGCVPVNRDGRDIAATKQALRLLDGGEVVGVFPQGGIRAGGPPTEGKEGIGLLALRSGAPVIPFFVEGSPHSDSIARSILTPSHTVIHAGKPMYFAVDAKPSRADYERVTSEVLEAIGALAREEETEGGRARPDGHTPPGERA